MESLDIAAIADIYPKLVIFIVDVLILLLLWNFQVLKGQRILKDPRDMIR